MRFLVADDVGMQRTMAGLLGALGSDGGHAVWDGRASPDRGDTSIRCAIREATRTRVAGARGCGPAGASLSTTG